jgi:hypothetical protein
VGTRLSGVALAALLVVAATGAASKADGLRDYVARLQTLSTANDGLLEDLSKHYRNHANVRLGPEQRLGNGVAWRLLIDVRTGAAVPRIAWMADRNSLVKANRLFEALHGAALVDYDIEHRERRRMELEWHAGKLPEKVKRPYLVAEHVAVTYATSRLVSYVEMHRRVRMSSRGFDIHGWVLDLERGQINEIESCHGANDYWRDFRFGDLLEICGDATYNGFMTLWTDKVRQAFTKARGPGWGPKPWDGSRQPLEWTSSWMALYLTPTGLAVYDKLWRPEAVAYYASKSVMVNPIILPYRELEPFIKLGPWRDELMK